MPELFDKQWESGSVLTGVPSHIQTSNGTPGVPTLLSDNTGFQLTDGDSDSFFIFKEGVAELNPYVSFDAFYVEDPSEKRHIGPILFTDDSISEDTMSGYRITVWENGYDAAFYTGLSRVLITEFEYFDANAEVFQVGESYFIEFFRTEEKLFKVKVNGNLVLSFYDTQGDDLSFKGGVYSYKSITEIRNTKFGKVCNEINFLPQTEVDNENFYPVDAVLSTTAGTGILIGNDSNTYPVYLLASHNLTRNETKVIINETLSVLATVSFTNDGILSIVGQSETVTFQTKLADVAIVIFDGYIVLVNDMGIAQLHSKEDIYAGCFPTTKHSKGDVVNEVVFNDFSSEAVIAIRNPKLVLNRAKWGNEELYSEANYKPIYMEHKSQNMPAVIMGRCGSYSHLLHNDVIRTQGFIEDVVTLEDIPLKGIRVLCYDERGTFTNMAFTNEAGIFRFDYLLVSEKYRIVAQFSDGDVTKEPLYKPVVNDWVQPDTY